MLGLDLDRLSVHWNCSKLADFLPVGSKRVCSVHQNWVFFRSHWCSLQEKLCADLAGFHTQFPDELGPDSAHARRMSLPQLPVKVCAALIEELLAAGMLQRSGAWLYLPTHCVTLSDAEEALYRRIQPRLQEASFDPSRRDPRCGVSRPHWPLAQTRRAGAGIFRSGRLYAPGT